MDINVPSAVEVFTTLRYINVHLLTYLLYLLQNKFKGRERMLHASKALGDLPNPVYDEIKHQKFNCEVILNV